MSQGGWIGVDLDGTLAHYSGWVSETHIGEPVAPMLKRVQDWLNAGRPVKIFTARAHSPLSVEAIEAWCAKHVGCVLPVTAVKDYKMIELWDDRAVQVVPNEGIPFSDPRLRPAP